MTPLTTDSTTHLTRDEVTLLVQPVQAKENVAGPFTVADARRLLSHSNSTAEEEQDRQQLLYRLISAATIVASKDASFFTDVSSKIDNYVGNATMHFGRLARASGGGDKIVIANMVGAAIIPGYPITEEQDLFMFRMHESARPRWRRMPGSDRVFSLPNDGSIASWLKARTA